MSAAPKVSVIIPVYNTEIYLRECLDSVVNQTLKDIEIICVDDGSTDGSLTVLREYEENDSRVVVITQSNSGSGPARNNGIMTAKGEYVVFIDADDLYPEELTLEKLYKAANENHANICGGSFSSFRDDGVIKVNYSGMFSGYTFHDEGEVLYSDYQFDYGYHRFLYKREFLLENNILFPSYLRFQDPPFFVKAMIAAKKFYAIRDVTYRYRSQHRNIAASEKKTIGLIKGLTDNIQMAIDNDLHELYTLTINRCCKDYWSVLAAAEKFESQDTHDALKELNKTIDMYRLNKGFSDIYKLYLIRNQQKQLSQKQVNEKAEAALIRASVSYKIGRAITWLPSKIRGGIRCYQEHGMRYTVHRVKEKLRGR